MFGDMLDKIREQKEISDVVDLLSEWIEMDVNKEQIRAVLWAIMMTNEDDKIMDAISVMREDYRKERMELDGMEED